MDIGLWWLTFAGIAIFAMGHGHTVVLIGAAGLVLTQGRNRKSIVGKFIGGVSSLYQITTYMSDVLSYSRLMALALATSVIAMVFNLLAGMTGGVAVIGIVFFAMVFLIGHIFNMGVNLIGTYVHAARLQYLEYFNRFYESGGSPFKPLAVKTRFVDIIKEED
jgi:V/A-type H+-transporting ATPase subunit I